jgi:hypothetical protein
LKAATTKTKVMTEIRELLDPGMAFDIFKISKVIFGIARPPPPELQNLSERSDVEMAML